jgi:hypothetical protein
MSWISALKYFCVMALAGLGLAVNTCARAHPSAAHVIAGLQASSVAPTGQDTDETYGSVLFSTQAHKTNLMIKTRSLGIQHAMEPHVCGTYASPDGTHGYPIQHSRCKTNEAGEIQQRTVRIKCATEMKYPWDRYGRAIYRSGSSAYQFFACPIAIS